MNYDKLESMAKEKGISKTFLCQLVGRERYYLRDCKKNSFSPPVSHIESWANALDTTVDYLTDKTEDPSPKKKEPVEALDEVDVEVLAILHSMSVEDKLELLEYLKGKM